MHTAIKLFDLTPQAPSTEGRKIVPAAAKLGEKPTSDQLNGFMDIMGALMALPREQWENALPDLDAVSFETDSNPIDSMLDPANQSISASEMLQLLMNLNGTIQPERHDNEPQDKESLLLNMAKAIMNEQLPLTTGSDAAGTSDWKSEWFKFESPNHVSSPAGNACQDDVATAVNQEGQNEILGNQMPPAGIEKMVNRLKPKLQVDSTPEAGPDSDGTPLKASVSKTAGLFSDGNPMRKANPLQKGAEESSQPFSKATDGLSQAAGILKRVIEGRGDGGPKQQPADGIPAPTTADKTIAGQLQSVTDAKSLHSEMDAQALSDGDDLEGGSIQKPSASVGGLHGILSRTDVRPDQGVVQVSGGQEAMHPDKEMQADVIRQIVQRMSMHTQGAQSKMVIRLQPEILGDVHMHVVTENHQVTVRMMTDSFTVKEIVEQNLQHLRSELQHHGLEIQKFDVFVANDDQGWKQGQEQAGFKDGLRKKQQRLSGSKVGRPGTKAVSDAAVPHRNIEKNLNEIDYFA